mgnify:CR=1 FL=1
MRTKTIHIRWIYKYYKKTTYYVGVETIVIGNKGDSVVISS